MYCTFYGYYWYLRSVVNILSLVLLVSQTAWYELCHGKMCMEFEEAHLVKGPVLKIRRGKRDNLGIMYHITPLKNML